MASTAESSMASVPLIKILALQENLINQTYRAPNTPYPQAASLKEYGTETGDSDVQHDHTAAISTFAAAGDAYDSAIPVSQEKPAPPRLSSSKSAPEHEMDAMVPNSDSQIVFKAMTRAASFHGGFPGGDTQPVDTQVYRDYTELISKPTHTTPQKPVMRFPFFPADEESPHDPTILDRSPKMYAEGDTGFIDLAGAYQAPSPTAHSIPDTDEIGPSPQTQYLLTSATKSAPPETPALAGQKHNRGGEVITSAPTTEKKTPGLSQLFGSATRVQGLSATQMFNQTQAPSSSVPDAPRSDPVLTRPFPSLHTHLTHSSPAAITSSPLVAMHSRPGTAGREPRDSYTSMKESQERRRQALTMQDDACRQRVLHGIVENREDNDGDDDDEEDCEQRRYHQRRLHKILSDQAVEDLPHFSAPSRPGSRSTLVRRPDLEPINLITPTTASKGNKVDFEFSIDDRENDAMNDEELLADDDEPLDGGHSDHDEYDELGPTVLRSQGAELGEDEEEEETDCDRYGCNVIHLDDAGHANGKIEKDAYLLRQPADVVTAIVLEPEGTLPASTAQRSAVADSQPPRGGSSQPRSPSHLEDPSSMPGIVPGSQCTSPANRAIPMISFSGVLDTSSVPRPPTMTSQARNDESQSRMPSSPPLLSRQVPETDRASSPLPKATVPDDTEEASLMRRQMILEFHTRGNDRLSPAWSRSELADSDGVGLVPHASRQQTALPAFADSESDSVPILATTQKNFSDADPSPTKLAPSPIQLLARQNCQIDDESPRKAAGVLKFGDIAADSTTPQGSGEDSLDIDGIMGNVMTADDEDFINAVSSPHSNIARKRQKITSSRRGSSSRKELIVVLSPTKQTTPPSQAKKLRFHHFGKAASEDEQLRPAKRAKMANHLVHDVEMSPAQPPLRSSPSKANELPVATPERDKAPNSTPDSVKKREDAGAKAASQLLETRLMRSKPAKPVTHAKRVGPLVKRTTRTPKAKASVVTRKPAQKPVRHSKPLPIVTDAPIPTIDGNIDEAEVTADGGGSSAHYANRVFALFKGVPAHYYPATCLSSSADGSYVRFDDGACTALNSNQICSLELKVGDQIKVDIPGMRGKTCLVTALKSSTSRLLPEYPPVDIYGHVEVEVQAKAGRDSLQANGINAVGEGEVVVVPLTKIYIVQSRWKYFADRRYTNTTSIGAANGRFQTPSTGAPTPQSVTPASRSRRSTLPAARFAALHNPSRLREGSVTSSTSVSGTGLFAGMAFAISYGSNETEKATISRLIQRNGGLILDEGFEELFVLPSLGDCSAASPSKKLSIAAAVVNGDAATGLRLKPEYEDLGFVALLADRHSRRAKYVQALALGLPTLSGKWITDSLDASKNISLSSASPQPSAWSKYLLPAGESAYLSGAVRSRTLPTYDAASAKFANVFDKRDKLLRSEGVLIVAGKKGKSAWEGRKAYAFLTLALGAGQVKRVAGLAEVRSTLDAEPDVWTWVYVDGAVTEAETVLFGASKAQTNSKKRKRGDVGQISGAEMCGGNGGVRVVGNEFVVQSLILGALID